LQSHFVRGWFFPGCIDASADSICHLGWDRQFAVPALARANHGRHSDRVVRRAEGVGQVAARGPRLAEKRRFGLCVCGGSNLPHWHDVEV
jgi:hypothetical protein